MHYPDYNPALDPPPLDAAELDTLDDLLAGLPGDAVMNIEAMDGYLTALLLGPRLAEKLPAARWMPVIWGGDGTGSQPFRSEKQRKRVVVLALRHLRSIERALAGTPEDWEPIFSVAETPERELADAEDWCTGFLMAVALDEDAWAGHWDDALLAPVARLGGDGAAAPETAEARDAESRAAAEAVAALAQRDPRYQRAG